MQLFSKSYSWQTMVAISSCLGNVKSQVLQNVEREIWKTLFDLTSGTRDPLDLLQQLSRELPWSQIGAASSDESERRWFRCGMHLSIPCFLLKHLCQMHLHWLRQGRVTPSLHPQLQVPHLLTVTYSSRICSTSLASPFRLFLFWIPWAFPSHLWLRWLHFF